MLSTSVHPLPSAEASPKRIEWIAVILWVGSYFACRAVLENAALPNVARYAVALTPVLPFLIFLRGFIARLRSGDELARRIQLEALALAFPLAVVGLMLLGLLELAAPLDPNDWSYRHVWVLLPVLYFIGVAIASRRYE